jgi:hypothetical protein
MVVFSGNEFYFDEYEQAISEGYVFDGQSGYSGYSGYSGIAHFDQGVSAMFTGLPKFSFKDQSYTTIEIGNLIVRERYIGVEDYSKYVDLMRLIPAKFRTSVVLQQFVYQMGLDVGTWIGDINDLEQNLDPYYVAQQYLPYLARLIGLTIVSDATTSDDNKRQQLLQAIDLYRMKGTYNSLKRAAYLSNVNVEIFDKYCSAASGYSGYSGAAMNYNDSKFVNEPWWAGPVGTNPPDLDSTYFKTPHGGIVLPLTVVQGTAPTQYLYKPEMLSHFITTAEAVRPVNVVIHYTITLNGQTDKSGTAVTTDGNVNTCLIGGWLFPALTFDFSGWNAVSGYSGTGVWTGWSGYSGYWFDQGVSGYSGSGVYSGWHAASGYSGGAYNALFFDQTPDVALRGISNVKFGNGSKNTVPTQYWVLQSHIPTMDRGVDKITIYPEYALYEINVPKATVQSGISELGLYLTDNTTLKIGCTFPDIDLDGSVELKIAIKFYYV